MKKPLIELLSVLLFIVFIITEYKVQENWARLTNSKMERIAKIDGMEVWLIGDKVVIRGVID